MYGISGFIGSKPLYFKKKSIINTLSLMRNRGTNDNGVFQYDSNDSLKINLKLSEKKIILIIRRGPLEVEYILPVLKELYKKNFKIFFRSITVMTHNQLLMQKLKKALKFAR